MKVIIYTLNEDGTIPSYVLDGGYFGMPNNNNSPRNFDFIGIATDNAQEYTLSNKEALVTYLNNKSFKHIHPITNEEIPVESVVNSFWEKV